MDLRRSLDELDGGFAEELNRRVGELGEELPVRLDELAGRADGLVGRDEAAATAARQAAWVQNEVEKARQLADDARVQGRQELDHRVDEAVGALRADLEEQGTALGVRLQANAGETAALHARIDALHEAAAGRAAREAHLERRLEQRFEGLAARITEEVAGARADTEQARDAVRQEAGVLSGSDRRAARSAPSDVRVARRQSLADASKRGRLADDAVAAGSLQDLPGGRRVLDARRRWACAIKNMAGKIDELHGLRADDLAAAERAGAELAGAARRSRDAVGRSDPGRSSRRCGPSSVMSPPGSRSEMQGDRGTGRAPRRAGARRLVGGLAPRADRGVAGVGRQVGASWRRWWRSSGAGSTSRRRSAHEQARATERALRKGLASLGERLVDTESAYVDAGKALRRSIERLGAAVVEADARMADQIPVSEAEGCVAFAPTAAGYRLVELPGTPPEIGSTIELEECEGPLVVTRYGRSPLPLDSRPCAYLDRA